MQEEIMELCRARVELLDSFGFWFLMVSILMAVAYGSIAAFRMWRQPLPTATGEAGGLAATPAAVEAVGKLVEALTKAPAWIGLFIGGFALLWLASSISDGMCGNVPDPPASNAPPPPQPAPAATLPESSKPANTDSEAGGGTTR